MIDVQVLPNLLKSALLSFIFYKEHELPKIQVMKSFSDLNHLHNRERCLRSLLKVRHRCILSCLLDNAEDEGCCLDAGVH